MKTERRHELQENALSAELSKTIEFFKRWGNYIAGAVLVVAIIALLVVYAKGRARDTAAALEARFESRDNSKLTPQDRVELLESLAAQTDSDRIAALSTVELGAEYARRMLAAGPADAAQWKEHGDSAEKYYRETISRFGSNKLAVAKAHLGLAKLAESRQDFDAARKEYEAVTAIDEVKNQPVAQQAALSLSMLGELAKPVRMATTAPATKPSADAAAEQKAPAKAK